MCCNECQKAADMIHAVLDDEVSCEELKTFNNHLENCSKCAEHFDKEKVLFEQIKSKIEKRCCPKEVLNSVLGKIEKLVK